MYYKLGRAGKALDRFGVIDFATTIAPGVRDVLLTGKVYEAVQRPRGGRHKDQITYDAVVLDAPPTGRICQFLGVNSELAGLAKVGPIKTQADKVMELLRSPRTAVHLVTILEEMPVQETSRRDRRAARRRACRWAASWSTWSARRTSAPSALAQVRDDRVDPTAVASDLDPRQGRRRRRPGRLARRRGPRPRRTPSARGRAARARRGRGRARPTSCPAWPAASTAARSSSSPSCCATGNGMSSPHDVLLLRSLPGQRRRDPDEDRHPCSTSTRCSTTRHRDHRVLRLGRRRQDHDLRRARAARGRAGAQGRRADHRPGAPARAVDGHRAARQHPAPGAAAPTRTAGGSLDAMMLDMKRTFDEVVESQASPEKAKQILENPFYVALSSSFAGTQEYMAMEKLGQLHRQAPARRHLRPDRGRHAALALGARLPRRPGAAVQLPRRPVDPAAARPGARSGEADDGRASRW